jgi:uncharacterized protein YegP (UPF0339 family)
MIHIRKSRNGQLYFTVHADNGKVLATSETYKSTRNCKKGADALCKLFGWKVEQLLVK